jgi:hypothetical protein
MLGHSHPELKDHRYVVFVDSSRQYSDCSNDVSQLLGYDRTNLLKKSIDDLSYWLHDVPALFKDFLRQGKQNGEYLLRHFSGSPLPIRYRSFHFSDGCLAAWEPITDWRASYLAALSTQDKGKLGLQVDIALAAIYRRLYADSAEDLPAETERSAISQALSALGALRDEVPTALSPELLAVEKSRAALLRLANRRGDGDAIRVLFDEHRLLIESSIRQAFPASPVNNILPALMDRIAHTAHYYDPDKDPVLWVHDCIHLECKRLKRERS